MKIAKLDPDSGASISLSRGPLPPQKHGRVWEEVSPLAAEALQGPCDELGGPLASLPRMHLSHFI